MRFVASEEYLVLGPAHCHFGDPSALFDAVVQRQLLHDAILDRRPADGRFAIFVAFEDVLEFLLVGFVFGFDFGEGTVGGPEVGEAAVGIEGLGRDDGLGGIGGWGFGFGRGRGFWRWRWRGGRGVFYGGFFGEEVSEAGIEVAEGITVGGFVGPPEPAHGWLGFRG